MDLETEHISLDAAASMTNTAPKGRYTISGWTISVFGHVILLASAWGFEFTVPNIGSRPQDAAMASIDGILANQTSRKAVELEFKPVPAAPAPISDPFENQFSLNPDAKKSTLRPAFMHETHSESFSEGDFIEKAEHSDSTSKEIVHAELIRPNESKEDYETEEMEIQPELVSEGGVASQSKAEVTEHASVTLKPPIEYPAEALAQRITGRVVLRVHIDSNGLATQLTVLDSSGFEILDQAALRWVKKWKFQPAKSFGVPVGITVRVPVRFRSPE